MRHIIFSPCACIVLAATLAGAADLPSEDPLDNAKRGVERVEGENGPGSAEAATAWQEYGDLLGAAGRKADAVAVIRKALAIRLTVLGENSADTAYTLDQLGTMLEATDGE